MLDLIESGNADALEKLTVAHLGHVLAWWADAPAE